MTQQTNPFVRRALISVSDKTGIVDFAQRLGALGAEILSTGGTARALRSQGLAVNEISDYTGFPEIMAGRVKTLHPKVHGGILGRVGEDEAVMGQEGIEPIDLVVVNLYPFEATVSRPDCTLNEAVENIDIGGPTMIRAAAKNHGRVGVIVDPADYGRVAAELDAQGGSLSGETRFDLAVRAFEYTARYDSAIANYLGGQVGGDQGFPRTLNLQFRKVQPMRYGENPHQRAAFYRDPDPKEPSVVSATQLQGKALSYNNIADADAALECIKQFAAPSCVIVKHANPCGVAEAEDIGTAYEKAFQTDPTSAFGGIIAFNRPLDPETARMIVDRQFLEVLIAPKIDPLARDVLEAKKNVRVLEVGAWGGAVPGLDFKRVNGGLLVQDRDLGRVGEQDLKVVTRKPPTEGEFRDLLFAWRVVKFVKSNAIVYARERQTIGVGAGQMSRIYSARIAAIKAADEGLQVRGTVMASDAFFPFRDGIDAAAEMGARAVIQPGGSVRDEEVIAAADEHDMAMVFTGMRHFRH